MSEAGPAGSLLRSLHIQKSSSSMIYFETVLVGRDRRPFVRLK